MHYKYTYSYHHSQEKIKKSKNQSVNLGKNPEKNLKKIFRKVICNLRNLQKIKNKKFFKKDGNGLQKFFKKNFSKRQPILSHPCIRGVVHPYTTSPKHDNTTYLNAGRSLFAVCTLLVKIPLFAFLRYFSRAYMLL